MIRTVSQSTWFMKGKNILIVQLCASVDWGFPPDLLRGWDNVQGCASMCFAHLMKSLKSWPQKRLVVFFLCEQVSVSGGDAALAVWHSLWNPVSPLQGRNQPRRESERDALLRMLGCPSHNTLRSPTHTPDIEARVSEQLFKISLVESQRIGLFTCENQKSSLDIFRLFDQF